MKLGDIYIGISSQTGHPLAVLGGRPVWLETPLLPSHSLSNLPSAHSAPPLLPFHPSHSTPSGTRLNGHIPQRLYPTDISPTQATACLPDPPTPRPQKAQTANGALARSHTRRPLPGPCARRPRPGSRARPPTCDAETRRTRQRISGNSLTFPENAYRITTEAQGPTAPAHRHAPPESGPSSRRSEGFEQVEGLAIPAYSA